MNKYISKLNFPEDLKNMNFDEMELLSYEIRDFLVDSVSKTGGHLSSNLGVVEIACAVHKVFDTPQDKIIWDVGHQTYVHKILTGRAEGMSSLRQFGGMSGFPKMEESVYDLFDTGHSSTSISLGLGMATAAKMKGEENHVVSVIGDGAMTGGVSFEALNNAGHSGTNLIVLLNDNGMSISPNTGSLSRHLGTLTSSDRYLSTKRAVRQGLRKVPVVGEGIVSGIHAAKNTIKYMIIDGIFFEELGFKYIGPIDGHNIKELCETLEHAKTFNEPVLIHAVTKKGKGYTKAEETPSKFHGIGPFDIETGQVLNRSDKPSYSKVFGNTLMGMAENNENIVAISAAMIEGTGLDAFAKKYPDRIFDVGIAEAHAVTFASGLAKAGMRPYVSIYSTFLQRAYDHIVEDICLQNLPVTLCIDRAGIVGADGETHHGVFDVSYLKHIPNITVMAPAGADELEKMLKLTEDMNTPAAVRYPRGAASEITVDAPVEIGKAATVIEGKDVDIWALGTMLDTAVNAAEILKEKGIDAGVTDIRFVKPLDEAKLMESAKSHKVIVTIEDNVLSGGIGETISTILANEDVKVINLGWPDRFIQHGTAAQLYKEYGLDAESVAERIMDSFED